MSAKTLPQIRTEVKGLIKDDDSVLTETEINNAIKQAVRVLSQKSPRTVFVEQTGNGTNFQWALPTTSPEWIHGFSKIAKVEYPIDVSEQEKATRLKANIDYDVYEKTAGVYWFRLLTVTPTSGSIVRYTYTTYHVISDTASECSITDASNEDVVINYAASLCLNAMASKSVAVGNPTLGADTVSYQSRQSQYTTLAKYFLELSGLDKIPGFVQVKKVTTQDDGQAWLTHSS